MSVLNKPVVIIRMSDSGLIRQRWIFSLREPLLILDRYHYERRYSTEQSFRTIKFYDRLRNPDENYGDWQWLKEKNVPWDEKLQSQAVFEWVSRIKVVRQSDLNSSGSAPGAEFRST